MSTLPFPQQPRSTAYSDGYRVGMQDGERFANLQLFWIGVASGVALCGVVALAVVLLLGRGWI